ncbi:MAG: ATP-binding protein [Dolichospermum sp.]
MSRWFNIAGPCKLEKHYTISATSRLPDLSMLIEQESYFVLHAPRQTGKTTAMLALAQQLTATGRYAAVMVSVEVGSAFNHDPGAADLAILGTWYDNISIRLPKELQPPVKQWQQEEPGQRIKAFLSGWAKLEREYAIGSDRMDLCLRYKDVTLGIELKVWRDEKRDPQADGIEQLESYLARLGLDFGWLFIFDRRKNALPMEERLSTQVVVMENQRRITVIRA